MNNEEDSSTENNSKKQRLDDNIHDMAITNLPGSLELTASGSVRDIKMKKQILQSPTVLLTG